MISRLILLFLFFQVLSVPARAQQIIRSDNFESTTFPSTTNWSGDTNRYSIIEQNGSKRLRLNADISSSKVAIALPDTVAFGKLEFDVFFDFTGLSATNRLNVYFALDRPYPDGQQSGYLLQVGETGTADVFRLFRVTNGANTSIGADTSLANAGGLFKISLTRDTTGVFSLAVGKGTNGVLNPFLSVRDTIHTKAGFTVFENLYTSTRITGTSFDNITLSKYRPFIRSARVSNTNQITLLWSDVLSTSNFNLSQFVINPGAINPVSYSQNGKNLLLNFDSALPFGNFTLTVAPQTDGYNLQSAAYELALQRSVVYEAGDLFITEFMHNPPSGLVDYVEVYNQSDKTLDLSNWIIRDNNTTTYRLPAGSLIQAKSYVVLANDTLALFNQFGSRKFVRLSSFPGFNNTSTDQVRLFTNTGILVDSLQYETSWGGSAVALERRSLSLSATFRENWGPSPNVLKGTPGLANEIEADTQSPTILSASSPHPDSVLIVFSESLLPNSVQLSISNAITNGISITAISLIRSNTIALVVNPSLTANQTYTVTLSGITDLFGNAISVNSSVTVEYLQAEEATQGDILISEFMYDPPTGYTEAIELVNRSSKVVNLQGFTFNDNSGSRKIITSTPTIFRPGEYILIAPNLNLATFFPQARIISMGSNFASLNNSGDQIVIRAASGELLDSLEYVSSWGGTKKSVERRSFTAPSIFAENWGDSPSISNASFGAANAISVDNQAPILNSVFADSISVSFVFNERLQVETALNATFSTTLDRIEASREVSNSVLKINFNTALTSSVRFTVNLGAQSDIFGNTTSSFTRETEFVLVKRAERGDLLLSEFVYRSSDITPEFIEIYNTTNENVDLRNLRIADNRETITLSINSGFATYIKPNDYVAITTDEGFAFNGTNRIAVSRLPSLNDTGSDAIVLKTAQFTLDSLTYSFPQWLNALSGQSFERRSFAEATIEPINWGLNINRGHTAGNSNSVTPLNVSQQITFAGWLNPDTLSIFLTRFIKEPQTIEVYFDDVKLSPLFITQNRIRIPLTQPTSFDAQEIRFVDTDIEAPITQNAPISVQLGQLGIESLILTEIMYNPFNTETARQSDYIEVFNPNEFAVILPNPLVQIKSISSTTVTSITTVSDGTPQFIPAQSYAIIFPDTSSSTATSRLGTYFDLSDKSAFRSARTTLSLSSSTTAVLLRTNSGAVMDSVQYNATWHNPNVLDTRGKSLERVLLNGPSNDANNWSTSGAILGGTPGAQNTNFVEPGDALSNELLIFPNPFSPDEDGFEDNTTISWNLEGASYVISATIFDRFGRKVRTLAEGVVGSKNGSLIWNGKQDDGTFTRVGIYIILFKAIDNVSGKQFVKKETIVVARPM